jgi:phage-related protein
MRRIEFYRTANGRCPVEEFLDELTERDHDKVFWVMQLVEDLDMVPSQYFKKLVGTSDIWEVRAQVGGISYRLMGFLDGSTLVVLTNGFSKKDQKTPAREIALAEQRRSDYLQRRKRS